MIRLQAIVFNRMSIAKTVAIGLLVLAALALLFALFSVSADAGPGIQALNAAGLGAILAVGALIYRQEATTNEASEEWLIDANSLQDAIFITDLNGRVLGANSACDELIPGSKQSDTALSLLEPLHKKLIDRQPADDVLNAVLSAPNIKFSDRLTLEDGRVIERTTRPIDGTSERIWILCDVTQVLMANSDSEMHQTMLEADAARTAELAEQLYHAKAELEEKQTELTRLANTDPMTGLWNRRRFLSLAEDAIKEARPNSPPWVLMLDIDHFKRINDTYGHAAGDVAIRDFAHLIVEAVGSKGFVGRMGGEEFAAILTDCSPDDAYRIAERVRKGTTQMQTESGSEIFRFTTSIGIACWIHGEISTEPALDRADKALYSAKSYGRNRVVGYE